MLVTINIVDEKKLVIDIALIAIWVLFLIIYNVTEAYKAKSHIKFSYLIFVTIE